MQKKPVKKTNTPIEKNTSEKSVKKGKITLWDNLPKPPKNSLWGFFGLVIVLAAIYQATLPYFATSDIEKVREDVAISEVLSGYTIGLYSEIIIDGNTLIAKKPAREIFIDLATGTGKEVEIDKATLPRYDTLNDLGLADTNNPTKVTVKNLEFSTLIKDGASYLIGTIFFIVILFFIMARMGGGMGGGGGPMAFIRSRARMYDPEKDERITFADVAGSEEEKEDLTELVDFLKSPDKYDKLGAKIPRGVLMVGPPGTGKTLLARAVAGEAGVPFFSVSGSEFVEMFVGVGASRVRSLFQEAKEKAPSIIFIDEIDAIGKRRGPGMGGGHDEREQTLNQILTEMDGFDNQTHVIILAATNRADVLDKALLRPGRFDRKVTINLPNLIDREKILLVHAKNKPLDSSVDLKKIASATVGFSGADLANLLNESAILAGKRGLDAITHEMIQSSIEKIVIGNTRKTSRLTDYEKKLTAYHEVGHAILHHVLPHLDPVYKVSIIPRGPTGGVTWSLPEKDSTYISKQKFFETIVGLYGGRVAEELHFGSEAVTTGASNDIERATEIARAMVTRYGFDDELGAENFAPDSVDGNYLWVQGNGKVISEKTQQIIDEKVRKLLADAYDQAKKLLKKHQWLHDTIAAGLLTKEELLADEFKAYFDGVEGIPVKATV